MATTGVAPRHRPHLVPPLPPPHRQDRPSLAPRPPTGVAADINLGNITDPTVILPATVHLPTTITPLGPLAHQLCLPTSPAR